MAAGLAADPTDGVHHRAALSLHNTHLPQLDDDPFGLEPLARHSRSS